MRDSTKPTRLSLTIFAIGAALALAIPAAAASPKKPPVKKAPHRKSPPKKSPAKKPPRTQPTKKKPPAKAPADDMLARALRGPMKGVEDIIFAARPFGPDPHWYANISYYAEDASRKTYRPGGRLCRMNLRNGKVTVLLADKRGNVRDPHVHYDGKKILFSYRKGDGDHYHLYEIGADGTGLKQLTGGDYDDYEAVYLPGGDIMFVSTRCRRWVNCWLTQVGVLYRCGPDGSDIRPVSSNNDHDNTPWVMPDGRILYMRWEYTDRSQVKFHHLWTINADGTGQMVYYGNMHPGTLMIDAKPIPGTDRVVSVFSPGHGRREHAGRITIVDPDAGPDAQEGARHVNPKPVWRDPYAFSENCFLVASPRGIELMDGTGRTQLVRKKEGDMELNEPRPLIPRPREAVQPSRIDRAEATGRLVLADVTVGRNMDGVKPGEVAKLLILELLPEPIHFSGGMEPISRGGTFILERILGTVPVEPDGSANFAAPAMRSLFFVAMDKDDNAIQRMQSFVTLQPGEVTGCIGCHEQRTTTMNVEEFALDALKRPPSRIKPVDGIPDVPDFPRDVQPVLDKYCVRCHNPEKRAAGMSLAGDHGPIWSHSYTNLTFRRQIADGRNGLGNRPPRTMGASASGLMKKLTGGHHKVAASPADSKIVRFWLEAGAPYPGTYAAVGSGMLIWYLQGKAIRYDLEWPETKSAREVIRRRCAGCHQKKRRLPDSLTHSAPRFPRGLVFNLTRPAQSIFLRGPLAKEAGGYGTCEAKATPPAGKKKHPPIFRDTGDPDYKKLLAWIDRGRRWLQEHKRFDMPEFRPNEAIFSKALLAG